MDSAHSETSTVPTASEKHRNLVSEPMGDKGVADLAGIDDNLGVTLKEKGFDKASMILGQFLVMGRSKDAFISWLKNISGAKTEQAEDCYQCLNDWCKEFM
uniref:Barrier-to-autointegration factor-like protein n=1 Tax=Amblyomma maculatum TaxID=34609 RepID=G3MQQ5_AMBMU